MRISDWSSDVCSSDLFAEGAFSQAFVPILGQARSTRATEEVRVLLDRVALLLTAALALITVVGIIGEPWVEKAMARGLRAASRHADVDAAIWMTRLLFPYIICISQGTRDDHGKS